MRHAFAHLLRQTAGCDDGAFRCIALVLVVGFAASLVQGDCGSSRVCSVCFLQDLTDMSDTTESAKKRAVWRRRIYRMCLFTVFLVFPSVSQRVFSMLVCQDLAGTYYLEADFRVQCCMPSGLSLSDVVCVCR